MQVKPPEEDQGVITKTFLKRLCKSDFKQYYSTPNLNDVLYLHYKGFKQIANLEEYTGLKVIYLEGNCIKRIQGLEQLVNLRCLYLHENLIGRITGLETLKQLTNLNLSDNLIEKVEGLGGLPQLSNLQLKNNRLGGGGWHDLSGLLECNSVSALDVSCNKIEDEEWVQEVLLKMQHLAVIYMQGNDFVKRIPHYRKSIISRKPTLKYIDDKPIFQDEMRYAMAWARGGLEQERKERAAYKQEQEEKQLRQHQEFRQMIERYKEEGRREREGRNQSESDSESNSHSESLETYKTPEGSNPNSENNSERQSDSNSQTGQASEGEQSREEGKKEEDKREEIGENILRKSDPAYLDELD